METRVLRYFQAVAEFRSYSRGAEFLRLSQPALSRQIKGLEQELGTALFVRHGHGVTLTEAGRVLLERCQVILRQLEQVRSEIRDGGSGLAGSVTLAVPPAAGTYLIPPLAERFGAQHPGVFLKVVGGYSSYIHEWLVRGQADLACLHDPLPQRGFETVPLVEEPVFLVGRKGSFRTGRKPIRMSDLARLPLVLPSRANASRRMLDRWIAGKRLSLNLLMEVDDPSIIRALLRAGRGFCLLTQGSFDAELRSGELEAVPLRPAASWQLALVMPAHGRRPLTVITLAETIISLSRELTMAGSWPGRPLV